MGLRGGRALHRAFEAGIILKGINGVLETLAAVAVFVVPRDGISRFADGLARRELARDPDDWLATHLYRHFALLTGEQKLFAATYLLAHGVVKVFLVASLLRGKLWAYPTTIGLLCIFISYQGVLAALRFSWGLALLTAFDVVIVLLIAREYRARKASEGVEGGG